MAEDSIRKGNVILEHKEWSTGKKDSETKLETQSRQLQDKAETTLKNGRETDEKPLLNRGFA